MHTIRLDISERVLDKVFYFLKNLPKEDVRILDEDIAAGKKNLYENSEKSDIFAFSNHAANTIKDWADEDDIWQ